LSTPTGITLNKQAVIVEVTGDQYGNTRAGNSDFGGGFARIIGTEWTADPAPPAVDDYIQFNTINTDSFQQGGVTYTFVPKENYLFIQAAPP